MTREYHNSDVNVIQNGLQYKHIFGQLKSGLSIITYQRKTQNIPNINYRSILLYITNNIIEISRIAELNISRKITLHEKEI